jgi:UDP-glucose 4-epimerase
MKYLVTGGAGFVGSHLVDRLIADGHSVIVLDNFSTGRKENLIQHARSNSLEVIEGNIRDANLVDTLVTKSDRVFHLAAAVGVFNILQQPIESIKTNIGGSENVFNSCLKFMRPVLITSSSEIYGKNTSDSLREDADRIIGAPQKVRWSYSDAKAIDEAIAVSLHEQQGLETRIVRLFNTVGPRQVGRYGMVVPRFVSAALGGEPLTVYGSGMQTRCFGHVLDIIDALIRLEQTSSAIGRPVNVGVDREISIADLAAKVIQLTQSASKIEFIPYSEAYGIGFEDMLRRVPDINLLKQLTGWSQVRDIVDIIKDIHKHFIQKSN